MNYDADKAKGDALGKTNIISPTVTLLVIYVFDRRTKKTAKSYCSQ
jgi:hypothetical protein